MLERGALELRFQCIPVVRGACSDTVHVVVSEGGARLTVANRHIVLGDNRRTMWSLHLPGSWRRRLARHRGHLTATIGKRTIYSGQIR